jgi:hypothetical protein
MSSETSATIVENTEEQSDEEPQEEVIAPEHDVENLGQIYGIEGEIREEYIAKRKRLWKEYRIYRDTSGVLAIIGIIISVASIITYFVVDKENQKDVILLPSIMVIIFGGMAVILSYKAKRLRNEYYSYISHNSWLQLDY